MNNSYTPNYAPPVFVPMSEFGLNAKASEVYIDPQNIEESSLSGGFNSISIEDGQIEWLQRAQNASVVQTPDGLGAVPGVWMDYNEALALGVVSDTTQFVSTQGVNLEPVDLAKENNVYLSPTNMSEKIKAKRNMNSPIQDTSQVNKKSTSFNPSAWRMKSPLEDGLKPRF